MCLIFFPQPDPSKCRAVGAGLELAEKHQLTEFEVTVADADGVPCTSNDGITITAEVTSIADELTVTGSVVSKTPAVYAVSYQPIKCGQHEVIVKVNGTPINNSPFAILVRNNPHPKYCKAIGEQVESAQKNNPAKFMVQLADAESDPCVTVQEVTAELKSLMDGSITNADVVSQTPATYEVPYQPKKSGEHKLIVKVNGMQIHGSPFTLFVHNIAEPQNCKAVGEGISKAEKHKTSEFMVQLADAEGDPCVTEQKVAVELKSLVDGSITKAHVVSKTSATYEVAYQPSKSGEHKLIVKVNGIEIHGSPFALLVHNIPDPQSCKAVGKGITKAEKHKTSEFMVQLADAEDDPCITKQEVVVDLKSLVYGSITKANVVSQTPATYEVTYKPSKSGEHKLIVKVNGIEIHGSPFALLVHNIPDPQSCKAVGKGITKAEKHKTSEFMVQLADAEGDPCITKQEVVVDLKSLVYGSITKANVVSKTPASYEVSYQPSKSGEHKLSVKVNGVEISGSPFELLVHNIPDPQNCIAVGKGITKAEKHKTSKFMVELADAEFNPCITKQEVAVDLKSLADDSVTKHDVVSQTPATYEVTYQPSKSGEHKLIVKVNGMEIRDSPTVFLVHNIPDPQNCKAVGEGITKAEKHNTSEFMVQLADAEGDPCVAEQKVAIELKSLADDSISKPIVMSKTPATYIVSYQPSKSGEHELSVKVNEMHISGSPFALLVHNIPDPRNCKAVGIVTSTKIIVQLADKEGDPCVTKQEVTAELKCLADGSVTKAKVVSQTPATYEVSYQPSKSGEHVLIVKVNGMEINGSPFAAAILYLRLHGCTQAATSGLQDSAKSWATDQMKLLVDLIPASIDLGKLITKYLAVQYSMAIL